MWWPGTESNRRRQPFQGWIRSGLSYSLQRENGVFLSRKQPIYWDNNGTRFWPVKIASPILVPPLFFATRPRNSVTRLNREERRKCVGKTQLALSVIGTGDSMAILAWGEGLWLEREQEELWRTSRSTGREIFRPRPEPRSKSCSGVVCAMTKMTKR